MELCPHAEKVKKYFSAFHAFSGSTHE